MFSKIIEELICNIQPLFGGEYVGRYKAEESEVGIDTTLSKQFYIQDSRGRAKQITYDKNSKLYTTTRYFDLVVQYNGQLNASLECDVIYYFLKEYGDVSYTDDRKTIFKTLTGEELQSDIQLFFLTFAITIRSLNNTCNW